MQEETNIFVALCAHQKEIMKNESLFKNYHRETIEPYSFLRVFLFQVNFANCSLIGPVGEVGGGRITERSNANS